MERARHPWVRAIAMALACGNTVILKASEICPATHRLIGEVMLEAGLAPGVVNIVTNAPADVAKIVDALISHPAVRRVNFTGSTRVGRIIGETAARHLKPALLELGGKAPFLVLDDTDLDEAVKAAAFGGFVNQGQVCVSTERIVVDVSIADTFVAKLRQKVTTMPAGDPRRGDFVLGSIVSREAAEHYGLPSRRRRRQGDKAGRRRPDRWDYHGGDRIGSRHFGHVDLR
jgi:acyl-CoA reductase-like NAD-dependent aldehyde dehydrogenase